MNVFVLQHHRARNIPGSRPDWKGIGVYRTTALAEAARERVIKKPGFVDYPDCFEIREFEVDVCTWTEGFKVTESEDVPL